MHRDFSGDEEELSNFRTFYRQLEKYSKIKETRAFSLSIRVKEPVEILFVVLCGDLVQIHVIQSSTSLRFEIFIVNKVHISNRCV